MFYEHYPLCKSYRREGKLLLRVFSGWDLFKTAVIYQTNVRVWRATSCSEYLLWILNFLYTLVRISRFVNLKMSWVECARTIEPRDRSPSLIASGDGCMRVVWLAECASGASAPLIYEAPAPSSPLQYSFSGSDDYQNAYSFTSYEPVQSCSGHSQPSFIK